MNFYIIKEEKGVFMLAKFLKRYYIIKNFFNIVRLYAFLLMFLRVTLNK